ncbi:MAG TPA: pilin [Nitrospira sp.]|nr:pilin [Nitrospira sp.]
MKARASELILAASSLRTAIAEQVQSGVTLTNIDNLTGGSSQYVDSVSVTDGVINVVGKAGVGALISVVMTPSLGGVPTNVVAWSCTMLPAQYAPGTCSG